MHATLEARINQAFSEENYRLGLKLLREYANREPENLEILHRLSVTEEQIGDQNKAKAAHLKCIELSPTNYLAYLYAGYWFQANGRLDDALILYSYAFDINSGALALWKNGQHPAGTRLRSQAANTLVRRHFSDLHRNSVRNGHASKRILEAIWTQTHDQNYRFKVQEQKPQFFYVPDLPGTPYLDTPGLDWVQTIENQYQTIKAELLSALPSIQTSGRAYLDGRINPASNLSHLAGSTNWTAYDLYKNGLANLRHHEHFPKTLELLATLPLYGLDPRPQEVFFSLLKPKQHIKAHYGLSNHSLTVHLPLIIPDKGRLRVRDEWREWQEGKLIIFDDTFEHEAINESDENRIVLIFSIWHPDLSDAEKQDISNSFIARKNWLESRKPVRDFC